ncbi:adenylate/guanylate cyclase domain-containing protein [Argonema antarcticum]|uniref:adenylate/guanylate cyclase domain-containing protein n=1 Tax=Argonema antarcticum TaxID=2942763 RepID=UPI002012EE42|nr:adenylate/guanylate cyclase domain-containing protein [Argonema antarcticum]MCL1470949.1 PAS domain S-box protein [Argonema antarcticum A004/B2]
MTNEQALGIKINDIEGVILNNKANILIVDDKPDNLRLLSTILTKEGYEVRKALNGKMALTACQAILPNLILLDINMPEMNGYEVCQHLKADEQTRGVPVIFISAFNDVLDKIKAFAVGGVDYITKPFQSAEVVARVENHLALWKLQRQLQEQNAVLQQEIRDRTLAETALRQSEIRLRHQNEVLVNLSRNKGLYGGDLNAALTEITAAAAYTLEIERASVWLYNETNTAIECLDLFERTPNQHSEGLELTAADYPAYFKALLEDWTIAAHDARNDPRTGEFTDSYLVPLGITSMLDTPIRLGGQTVGVLCLEQVGLARHWTLEEENFAGSLADLASLALEARERKRLEEEVSQQQRFLDSIIEHIPLAVFAKDVANDFRYVLWNKASEKIFGNSRDEAIGRNVHDLYSQEQADFFVEKDLEVVKTGKLIDMDAQPINIKSGETRWLRTLEVPLIDDRAQVTHLLCISEDITERKQGEEALRSSEERFRSLVSNIAGAIYRGKWDSDWTMDFISDVIEEISGYPASDFIDNQVRTFASIIHPDDTEMVEIDVDRALSAKLPYILEYRIIHANGSIRWIYEKGQGIFDRDGVMLWLDGAIFDITERKRADEALRQSEAQKQAILLAIPDLMMRINRDGYYLDFIQPKYSQVSAISHNPIGQHLSTGFPPELFKVRMFYIHRALETSEVQIYEQQVHIDSGILDEEVRIVPINENEVLILVRDITARKRAEEALRQAEEKYRSIFENATEGIFQTSPDGRYLSANLAQARIYGYDSQEELIANVTNLEKQVYVDPNRRKFFVEMLANNGALSNFESQVYRKDGSIIWVSENSRAVCDAQGNLCYYEGIVTDITRRKLAEDALRESERQLRKQNKVLVKLTRNKAISQGNLSAALKAITKATAKMLGIGRVSVWLYDRSGSKIECLNLFESDRNCYSEGMEISTEDYPSYFKALQSSASVVAVEALTDPRLQELIEFYLIPLNIKSLLDVSINQSGKTLGIVCLEQVGRCHHWTPEEESFARSIADLVALAIESRDRKQAQEALRLEQEKSEQLLLNILPEAIANQLKKQQLPIAEHFNEVTILFADIVGFTPLSAKMPPIELVNLLNEIFSTFDELAEKHGLEKIKTIGDAYMVVGGLPIARFDHAEAIAAMALDMQIAINHFQAKKGEQFQIRIGINTGQVVAGVIGTKKFIYDLWGDAVNIASRMESTGLPGSIQITEATYERLKDKYLFEKRGPIVIKGKGQMITYLLTDIARD